MKESLQRTIARSAGMGVLLSMLFFYAIHVFGSWTLENYRPDPETTGTVLLHNTCALLGNVHTLRPNTGVPAMNAGITGTKLSGSFMNFTDGHVVGMILLAVILGGFVIIVRRCLLIR